MKLRFSGAVLLLILSILPVPPELCSMVATGIENPTCELVGPGIYRIDFQASPAAGPVEVFASSRPDLIDSPKPLLTIRKTPAEVSVLGHTGRIYFHLKPTSGATRVVSIRRLPLEGAKNFRDLGGYRTSDGHYVRWGQAYRSNHLVYAGQYAKILKRMAAGDLPVVEHCTAGKDRTGVFSAILLTALVVPRDTVIQDYMLSNQYLLAPDTIETTTADLERAFGLAEPPDISTVKTIMTAKPETLEATFDKIDKTYGSFGNYLRDALKLSASELTNLRERLLEP